MYIDNRRRRSVVRHGTSLLEVIMALLVTSVLVVPSSVAITTSVQVSHYVEHSDVLAGLASSRIEEVCFDVHNNFRSGRQDGEFGTDYPNQRFEATWSPHPDFPDRLMDIEVVAWNDANANRRLDVGETDVRVRRWLARRK